MRHAKLFNFVDAILVIILIVIIKVMMIIMRRIMVIFKRYFSWEYIGHW